MALKTYREKRNFKATPEPRGKRGKPAAGDSYLIQKHAARRLHYDLRLEMDGVLKSWAVTKGPSLVAGEKRLAVHVEDHPLEYGGFEGRIPKGEYGGGTVILWDRGRWSSLGDARSGYAKGHLDFELHGEKLGGRWHLVRMAHKPREKRENWLLIKGDDAFARSEEDPDILEEQPASVKTGRTIDQAEGEAPGRPSPKKASKKAPVKKAQAEPLPVPRKAKTAAFPGFVAPALATLRRAAPAGAKWLHEIKFDGYRLQAHVRNGKARLFTRSGRDWTAKFGKAIPAALVKLPVETAIADGELVVEGGGGASDFSALQADLAAGRTDRLVLYLFDLLYLDGHDMRPASLLERKAALKALSRAAPAPLRYSEHFDDDGEIVLRHACRLSLEGVVSKDRNAAYRSGRSKDWIKSKCAERQEFVIGGFVPSTTLRKAVGSLVLGYFDAGKLVYAGRVGTGFTQKVAADLFGKLSRLAQEENPFSRKLAAGEVRQVTFVRPELVAEVEFSTWTADGVVRHASFRGLREDKPPDEVVLEGEPKATAFRSAPQVRLTHPDRLYWKEAGVTKQGLADYYSEVWRHMGPFIVNRPLALVRCPNGVGGQCFFQKHAWRGQSKEILEVFDPNDDDDKPIIAIDGLAGLLGLVQGGVLEIHPWGSSLDHLERPDLINMDLDPGPGVTWSAIVDAAEEVRERLKARGLESFVKTSGGKGLHVVAPLQPRADWDEVKAFAKRIAGEMASDSPQSYVATVTKSKREGRILVDYLRNGRGATAVAPYSTRARPGAAVSMPVGWDELGSAIGPDYFTVENAPARLAGLDADPWADFRRAARPLGGGRRRAA